MMPFRRRRLLAALGCAAAVALSCGAPAPSVAQPEPPAPPAEQHAATEVPSPQGLTSIVHATFCEPGLWTYLGFRGPGRPPAALGDELLRRFPGAVVAEVGDGVLGILISEGYSLDVSHRQEAAAAAVGWIGDVVDFARVDADCTLHFTCTM